MQKEQFEVVSRAATIKALEGKGSCLPGYRFRSYTRRRGTHWVGIVRTSSPSVGRLSVQITFDLENHTGKILFDEGAKPWGFRYCISGRFAVITPLPPL